MASDGPTQQEIEEELGKAEKAFRKASYNDVCVRCGITLEAALKWAIRQHDAHVRLERRELGHLIQQARELQIFDETTLKHLGTVHSHRTQASHHTRGRVDRTLEHALEAITNTRNLLVALRILSREQLSGVRLRASRKASRPIARPLSLNRVTQLGEINKLLVSNINRVHVLGVHGEEQQGHAQCAELAYRQFSHGLEGLWKRVTLRWPGAANPQNRLGELVQKLGRALHLDDEALNGSLDHQIDTVRHRIEEHLDELGPLFVRHIIGTTRRQDTQLLQEYLKRVWQFGDSLVFPGVLTVELIRMERGFWMTDCWRAARQGLRNTRKVVSLLRKMRFPQLRGRAIAELCSVSEEDLREWIADNLTVDNPDEVIAELWTHSKHGRFELVLNHLPDYTGDLN